MCRSFLTEQVAGAVGLATIFLLLHNEQPLLCCALVLGGFQFASTGIKMLYSDCDLSTSSVDLPFGTDRKWPVPPACHLQVVRIQIKLHVTHPTKNQFHDNIAKW